jgi:hypothetical protein
MNQGDVEKAGIGGSTPSLATTIQSNYLRFLLATLPTIIRRTFHFDLMLDGWPLNIAVANP